LWAGHVDRVDRAATRPTPGHHDRLTFHGGRNDDRTRLNGDLDARDGSGRDRRAVGLRIGRADMVDVRDVDRVQAAFLVADPRDGGRADQEWRWRPARSGRRRSRRRREAGEGGLGAGAQAAEGADHDDGDGQDARQHRDRKRRGAEAAKPWGRLLAGRGVTRGRRPPGPCGVQGRRCSCPQVTRRLRDRPIAKRPQLGTVGCIGPRNRGAGHTTLEVVFQPLGRIFIERLIETLGGKLPCKLMRLLGVPRLAPQGAVIALPAPETLHDRSPRSC